MNHLKHRFFITLLILAALFLYSTMNLVTTQNDIDLTSIDGVMSSLKVYTGWLANGLGNMKELTGRAIDQDWSNTNASFFKKE